MTVLVAMSERHLARLAEVNLERQGWSVVRAESSQECVDKCRLARPSVVFIDSALPGFRDVQSRLSSDAATKEIKVIVLGDK